MLLGERQRKALHYFLLVVSLLLLVLMVIAIDEKLFVKYLNRLDLTFFSVFIVAFTLAWVLRALKLTYLVSGDMRVFKSAKIQLASAAVNLIVPLKAGDLLAARYIQREAKIDYSQALSSVLQVRVLDFVALTWVIVLILVNNKLIDDWFFSTLLVSGSMLVLIYLIASFSDSLSTKKRPVKRYILFLVNTYNRVLDQQKPSFSYFLALLLSIAIWSIEIFLAYWLAQKMHFDIELTSIAICVAFANICKALPLLPGGLGTYEAGFLLIGSSIDIPPDQLVTLSVVDHLLKKLYNTVVGFPIYMASLRGLFDSRSQITHL